MVTGVELLNSIRDKALSLPLHHPIRQRYRKLRRGCANVREDIQAYSGTTADVDSMYKSIVDLVNEVQQM